MGAALIWTPARGLGEDFTPKLDQAWVRAHATLAEAMTAQACPHAA